MAAACPCSPPHEPALTRPASNAWPRYNSGGSPDSTFNGTGIVTAAIGSGRDFASSLAIQTDGRIVVAGTSAAAGTSANDFALARFHPDGTADTTFNGTGKIVTDIAGGSGAEADLSDPDRDGVVNLMEFGTGSGPWMLNGQPGQLAKNGSSLEFTWPRRKAALAEVGYAVEWSESLTGPWIMAGVSSIVLTDGSVIQEKKFTLPAGGSGRRFVRLRVRRL